MREGETRPKSFLSSLSHYLTGRGLKYVASFISYPILTRLLPPEEYGLMGLVSAVVLFATAAAKGGQQEALVRFFPEHRGKDGAVALVSTVLGAVLAGGLVITVLYAVVATALAERLGAALHMALIAGAGLCIVRPLSSVLLNLVRSREQTRAYQVFDLLETWGALGAVMTVVLLVRQDAAGVLWARTAAEGVVLVALAVWALRRSGARPGAARGAILGATLAYGLPLVLFEMTNVALAFADRVIVLNLRGALELGDYTAAYNLGFQAKDAIVLPIGLAVTPIYMRLFSEEGPAATSAFLAKVHRLFWLVALPAITGMIAVRVDLITLLASARYAGAADVVPWVFGGGLVYGAYVYAAAGLYVERRTRLMTGLAAVAVALNLLLNLLWVPEAGALGAARATAVAYAFLFVALAVASYRRLPFELAPVALLRYAAGAALVHATASAVSIEPLALRLVARIGAGIAAYAAWTLLTDRDARDRVTALLRRRAP